MTFTVEGDRTMAASPPPSRGGGGDEDQNKTRLHERSTSIFGAPISISHTRPPLCDCLGLGDRGGVRMETEPPPPPALGRVRHVQAEGARGGGGLALALAAAVRREGQERGARAALQLPPPLGLPPPLLPAPHALRLRPAPQRGPARAAEAGGHRGEEGRGVGRSSPGPTPTPTPILSPTPSPSPTPIPIPTPIPNIPTLSPHPRPMRQGAPVPIGIPEAAAAVRGTRDRQRRRRQRRLRRQRRQGRPQRGPRVRREAGGAPGVRRRLPEPPVAVGAAAAVALAVRLAAAAGGQAADRTRGGAAPGVRAQERLADVADRDERLPRVPVRRARVGPGAGERAARLGRVRHPDAEAAGLAAHGHRHGAGGGLHPKEAGGQQVRPQREAVRPAERAREVAGGEEAGEDAPEAVEGQQRAPGPEEAPGRECGLAGELPGTGQRGGGGGGGEGATGLAIERGGWIEPPG